MMQTGAAWLSHVTAANWNLNVGAGAREFQSADIPFVPTFDSPPTVFVALSGFDSGHETNVRIEVYPYNVQREEFNIVVKTWDDTVLYGVFVTWFAFDSSGG